MKSPRSKLLLALILTASWIVLSGYVVSTLNDSSRTMQFWNPSDYPITFHMWNGFTDQLEHVESGSNPKRAIQEALDRWAQTTSLSIVLGSDTNIGNAGGDGTNIVTTAATAENRDLVGQVSGVSFRLFFPATGQIFESDVILNPSDTWTTREPSSSSSEVSNLFDVLLHEFGHTWNLDHTISRGSTMFFSGGGFDFGFNDLSWDDIAGANVVYPMVGLSQVTGSIEGRVTRSGTNVFGAFVGAVDERGVLAGSAITMPNGMYQIKNLPPGNYTLYVEPLDGLTTPENVSGVPSSEPMVTDFLPAFWDESMTPSVSVLAGTTTSGRDFSVVQGEAPIKPIFIGTDKTFPSFSTRPGETNQNRNAEVAVGGDGVAGLRTNGGMFFLGDLSAGSATGSAELGGGVPVRIFPVPVPLNAATGQRSIFMQNSSDQLGVISGGLEVFRRFRFLQAYAQFGDIPGFESGLFLINTNLNNSASGKLSTRAGELQASSLGVFPGERAPISVEPPLATDPGDGDLVFQLSPGGGLSVRTPTGGKFLGSLRAEADRAIGGTVLFESDFGTTGVGPSRPLYTFMAPIEFKDNGGSVNTGLAITNLEERPAQIYMQVQDQEGSIKGSPRVIDLAAGSHRAAFINELVPGSVSGDFDGSVVVTSNRQIGATVIALRSTISGQPPDVFTTLPIVQNRSSSRSFFAQFFHQASFFSRLILLNPSPHRTANVTIQVRDKSGSPISVALSGGGTTLSIPRLGSRFLQTLSDVEGSVEISSQDVPVGGVVLFSGPGIGTAGVPESFPLKDFVIPLDRGDGADTGIALLNIQQQTVNLTVTVRDLNGTTDVTKPITLQPRERIAAFPNEPPFDLGLPASFTGSLWVSAVQEVAAMSIRIDQVRGVFTTFPVISREHFITPAD